MGLGSIVSHVKVPKSVILLGLKAKKHAPTIMVVAGAVMVVGGTIGACKQTIKAHEILQEATAQLDETKTVLASGREDYTEENAKTDRRNIYIQTGVKLAKTYIVPVAIGATGLGLMLGAHKILHGRNVALTAAYAKLLDSYKKYRTKVAEELGTEEEKFLASGARMADVPTQNEDGEEVTESKAVINDGSSLSPYARIFDESNGNWSHNPSSNLNFLKSTQAFANQKLQTEGHLFLNEVYRMLGFRDTPEGAITGWMYSEDEDFGGDGFVDFGIYELLYDRQAKIDFINAIEPCIWLDFNVDGCIWDKI